MPRVYAPFNFVPLSRQVFFPDWADKISQDIPFEDGMSGYINLTFKAETPIFVRDGHTKEEEERRKKDDEAETAAQLPDGRYYLPATSVKGCIRNVLEILGKCKMHVDKSARFAQREWKNHQLYTLFESQGDIKGGWLRKVPGTDDYEIVECKAIYRISMEAIDRFVGDKIMRRAFCGGGQLNESDGEKNASHKYKLLEKAGIAKSQLENLRFQETGEAFGWHKVEYSPTGDIIGTIVFTGQPNKVKTNLWGEAARQGQQGAGKFYEFVFVDDPTPKVYSLSLEEFQQYEFIYKGSLDWNFSKERMAGRKGLPVFFRKEDGKIKDFGLALLYRLPYSQTPAQIEGKRYTGQENRPDLAECIFGYTNLKEGKEKKSLRGRVQFSNFISDDAKLCSKDYILILNGPKASYYPMYIQQNGRNGVIDGKYMTYNDGNLSGWKRYHTRNDVWEKNMRNVDLDSKIRPVDKEATFVGRIYFHNLLPQELGALLSSITFHGTKGCCHQIGKAKPYGFGKVSTNISSVFVNGVEKQFSDQDIKSTIGLFEETINADGEWRNLMKELITLAGTSVSGNDYVYMILEMAVENEFTKKKKERQFLPRFSTFATNVLDISNEFTLAIKEARDKEAKEAEAQRKAQEEKEKLEREEEEARKKAEQEALAAKRREERLNAGLSFLEEKNEKGEYKVTDFKGVRNRVKQWLKQKGIEVLPKEETQIFKDTLERIKAGGKKAMKEWNDEWIKEVLGE